MKPTHKFKKGDKVREKECGDIDIVESIPGMEEYDDMDYMDPERGFVLEDNEWCCTEDWELLKKAKPKNYKFALVYELEEDPCELFEKLSQVKKRILELTKDSSLKRHSIKVIEIKKLHEITLEDKTVIKGLPKK